jgi:hypothetical protein
LAGFAVLLAAAIFTFSLAGCGDGGGGGGGNNNPTVASVVVWAKSYASSVAKGGKLQFSVAVVGENNPSQTVTWEITTTGKAAETTISSSGELAVANGETVAALTVKATSVADNTKWRTNTVNVVEGNSISSVTVNGPSDAAKGRTRRFSATVAGPGAEIPDQAVIWEMTTDGIADGTRIDSTGGQLTVAEDEEKTSIEIKATSVLDTTKSDTKNVSIVADSSQLATAAIVTGVTVKAADSVNAGETLKFFAVVEGTDNPDQAVTWEMTTDGVRPGTGLSETGGLVVSATETKTSITVKATSVADDTKSGTASVTVNAAPTVTSVVVSAFGNAASVTKGGTLQFSATVTGTNNPAPTVTWTITTTGIASGTGISAAGLLTVAAGETKTSLEVKATSTVDTTKSGTKTVVVNVTGGGGSNLSGNIIISTTDGGTTAATTAATGTALYAVYSGGTETVTYQWKKDGAAISSGGTGASYTPTAEGSYTVTVSAPGYQSKTSAACAVSAGSSALTWTAVADTTFDLPTYSSIGDIAYGGGKFVAGGDGGKIAYSTDGVTWTPVVNAINGSNYSIIGSNYSIRGIAYGDGKFVVVGSQGTNSGRVAYSTDGATWTVVPSGIGLIVSIDGIAYGGGKFVAGGYSGKMAYSADGVTWTVVQNANTTFPSNNPIYGIAYGGGKFVAVGYAGKMAYSADGVTWTAIATTAFAFSPGYNNYNINGIAYDDGKFIAVGSGGKMAYSADGVTWTAVTNTTFGSSDSIRGIAYGGGKFVAVGDGGKTAYSADGVTWTAVTNTTFGSSNYIRGIAYGGGKFVAVGQSGKMAYSED